MDDYPHLYDMDDYPHLPIFEDLDERIRNEEQASETVEDKIIEESRSMLQESRDVRNKLMPFYKSSFESPEAYNKFVAEGSAEDMETKFLRFVGNMALFKADDVAKITTIKRIEFRKEEKDMTQAIKDLELKLEAVLLNGFHKLIEDNLRQMITEYKEKKQEVEDMIKKHIEDYIDLDRMNLVYAQAKAASRNMSISEQVALYVAEADKDKVSLREQVAVAVAEADKDKDSALSEADIEDASLKRFLQAGEEILAEITQRFTPVEMRQKEQKTAPALPEDKDSALSEADIEDACLKRCLQAGEQIIAEIKQRSTPV